MNYQLITHLGALQSFINWLPDLNNDECYMLCLFARKKYAPVNCNIRDDKCQLKRVTCNKKNLIQKIEQMQVAIGAYNFDGVPVPQEALALYITVNPRSLSKAGKNLLITLAESITKPYNGYNPQSLALTEIQKAAGRKVYFDLDIDGRSYSEVAPELKGKINEDAVYVLNTRGGIHLLIELGKIHKDYTKTWYNQLVSLPGVDIRGDNLIPVPGCYQGGFTPSLILLWN